MNVAWLAVANGVLVVAVVVYLWAKGAALVSGVTGIIHDLRLVVDTNKAASDLLLAHVEHLANQIDRNYAGVERIEAGAAVVASDLVVSQDKVAHVASDLAQSHERADSIGPGHAPGTASDAAQRSDPNTGNR